MVGWLFLLLRLLLLFMFCVFVVVVAVFLVFVVDCCCPLLVVDRFCWLLLGVYGGCWVLFVVFVFVVVVVVAVAVAAAAAAAAGVVVVVVVGGGGGGGGAAAAVVVVVVAVAVAVAVLLVVVVVVAVAVVVRAGACAGGLLFRSGLCWVRRQPRRSRQQCSQGAPNASTYLGRFRFVFTKHVAYPRLRLRQSEDIFESQPGPRIDEQSGFPNDGKYSSGTVWFPSAYSVTVFTTFPVISHGRSSSLGRHLSCLGPG